MAILAILILLLAAVIAVPLIAVARKRGETDENSPALVITYLILVVASVIATSSFSSLVESILPGAVRIFEDPSDVALTLSTLIVAGLVWGSVWLALERRKSGPNAARGLYLALTAAIAMSVVAYGAVRILALSAGVDEYEPAVVADLISFGALWMLVEWWRRRDEEVNVLKLFWGSVIGFGLAAVGLGIVLTTSLQELLGERTILVGESGFLEGLRWGFAVLAIGVVYFVAFWLRGFALRPSAFRNVYAAAAGMLGWFSALHALGFLLYALLAALVGLAGARPFQSVPGSLTTTLVGTLAYWHHRGLLGRERTELVRVVEYVFGGYALAFLAGSFSFLLTQVLIRAFANEPVLQDDGQVLLGTLVALAVAGVATLRYWGRALRLREPQSPSRRVALLVLFFGSAVTAAFALIFVLFTLLRSVLAGGGEELAEPLAGAVPITLVAGAVCWHTVTLRRRLGPPARPSSAPAAPASLPTSKIVTVVASDPGPLPGLIQGMRFLRRADGVGVVGTEIAGPIVEAINNASGRAVLVTIEADGFSVVPLS